MVVVLFLGRCKCIPRGSARSPRWRQGPGRRAHFTVQELLAGLGSTVHARSSGNCSSLSSRAANARVLDPRRRKPDCFCISQSSLHIFPPAHKARGARHGFSSVSARQKSVPGTHSATVTPRRTQSLLCTCVCVCVFRSSPHSRVTGLGGRFPAAKNEHWEAPRPLGGEVAALTRSLAKTRLPVGAQGKEARRRSRASQPRVAFYKIFRHSTTREV